MSIALVSLSNYEVSEELIKTTKDDFLEVEIKFVDNDVELDDSEITYMNEDTFIRFYANLVERNNYGMVYSEPSEYKAVRVKFNVALGKVLFDTEHYLDEKLRRHNERLKENEYTKAKSVEIVLNYSKYEEFKKELEETKAKMKKSFLADLFTDSQLEDNEHNRLICEKAWTVTCNTEYYGNYMSVNFYNHVEKWFRELKDLAI